MRAKSQWTPGGLGLWLIAAILATAIVCGQLEPGQPSEEADVEVEVEVVR